MIGWWFIAIGVIISNRINCECVKNQIKLWSPTKCEAGRSFFAKLTTLPDFKNNVISQPYLYPWLVHIESQLRLCSGALINDRYVLTAQSCILPPISPEEVTIHVGFYNGYDKGISEIFQPRILHIKAQSLILHPGYSADNIETAGNNLGLIKLKEPVKYSKTIYPVQLPAPGDKFMDYGNKLAENVEWSFLKNQGQDNKIFKEHVVKLLNEEQCRNFNNNYNQIVNSDQLCSQIVNSISGSCKNQNGGLLMVNKPRRMYNVTVLIGIASWDPPTLESPKQCSVFEPPSVYVRIDRKLEWIKKNTIDGQYCRY